MTYWRKSNRRTQINYADRCKLLDCTNFSFSSEVARAWSKPPVWMELSNGRRLFLLATVWAEIPRRDGCAIPLTLGREAQHAVLTMRLGWKASWYFFYGKGDRIKDRTKMNVRKNAAPPKATDKWTKKIYQLSFRGVLILPFWESLSCTRRLNSIESTISVTSSQP